ncbi:MULTISPECIES: universal stress protein [Methanobacterium]|jgi:nucleotide-binding universal stress UspA family protein|uniref:Universal stress protein UspA n=1 Tax=Methanobacterium bryantii TaxID=2161 RepID=A0A2A2HAA5_METBR|nr:MULTISPECIES: universal stress protein [Methanobacterium]OEC88547.1 universal stress protein UspA [Methanobacterium sp. A39]PAV06275.1 universal stress protein UspA [Methanobacterium bryantii]
MYKKILLPTDGSQPAHKAAEQAIWIAIMSNAELIVLHVIDTSIFTGLPSKESISKVKELLKNEEKNYFNAVQDILLKYKEKHNIEIKLVFMSKEGHPAHTIRKIVDKENIDLVVMGTSGKHGMDRFLLGSVAERVVRTASCPVLVVR